MEITAARVFRLAVPLSLTALLITLAVLQYRWVGELSENERRRMDASVRATAAAMARQLDDELAGAAGALQLDADELESNDGAVLAARWDRWAASAPIPHLVSAVYAVSLADRLTLRRFDRGSRTFHDVPWPRELASLRAVLQRDALDTSSASRRWSDADAVAIAARVVDVPVYRVTQHDDVAAMVKHMQRGGGELHGYTIVAFDGDAIRRELMPALVRRHVPDGAYRIALVRRDNRRPFYMSAPGSLANPDAAAPAFAVRALPFVMPSATVQKLAASAAAAGPGRRVVSVASTALATRPSLQPDPKWELLAVHRDGSVDAVVARSRARNLLVGTSILGILGAAIVLAMIYIRRTEALARQQLEFGSAMSHELRTPVAVVSAAAENLSRGVVDSRERGREYGAVLERESRRLAQMIEQVLEFARTRGAHAYARAAIDACEPVRMAVEATSAFAREHGRVVELRLPAGEAIVEADRDALARAVQNLIGNAVKYAGDEPLIVVSVSVESRFVCISVSDRGPGIPAHERARIAEPFFRGARAVDEQIPGTGLGLALVQRIAAAHAGRLTIESREGDGATFTIRLPRVERA
ncbi:MAG TPA: HAMP domain-containing sensor histidine kinase [Thermoanaerobaculia bacterium]|nr:HAMP domain-containing sensor histidine kinase [Thermoanaerobaculia bacterium]